MPAGTPGSTLNNIVQQTLTPRIDYWTKELSPFVRHIFTDSGGVTKADWGQGWVVRKTFRIGLAGAFEFAGMDEGTNLLDAGVIASTRFNIHGTGTQNVWPQPDYATSPGYFQWTIGLTKGKGNMYIPAELRRIDSLDASIGNQFAATIDATAENVALNVCNGLWHDLDTSQANAFGSILGTVTEGAGAGQFSIAAGNWAVSTAKTGIKLTSGSIRRFADGLRVDLWYITGTTLTRINNANKPVYVNTTDGLGDTIALLNVHDQINQVAGAAGLTVYILPHKAITANQDLAAASPTEYTPYSISKILRNSGTLYGSGGSGGIAIASHPEFKSYVIASLGSALDETLLLQHTARWQHGRGAMFSPDVFVTTEGVFAGYVEGLDGLATYDRNGSPLSIKGGVESQGGAVLTFTAFGRTYRLMTDPFCSVGTLYGVVTRNRNWRKYVPPRLVNTVTQEVFDSGVEFVVPMLTGSNDIWQGVKNSTGQTTDMLEAPFNYPYQVVPEIIPGIVVKGITEVYGPLG